MIFLVIGAAFLLLGLKPASVVAVDAVNSIGDMVQENSDYWTEYDSLFKKYGPIYGVDWTYLKAIALNESDLGRAASVARGLEVPTDIEGSKSSDGKSWGLMQVTLKTAKYLDPNASEIKLNEPSYSVNLAAKLFSQNMTQFSRYEDRWLEWVVKSYNQGAGNTKKERLGQIEGYAEEYWARFQRNLERVNS